MSPGNPVSREPFWVDHPDNEIQPNPLALNLSSSLLKFNAYLMILTLLSAPGLLFASIYPPLSTAYFLLMLMLLVYAYFHQRRKKSSEAKVIDVQEKARIGVSEFTGKSGTIH